MVKTLILAREKVSEGYVLSARTSRFDGASVLYIAGCRMFWDKEGAMFHWTWRKKTLKWSLDRRGYNRAVLFLDALERFDEEAFKLRPKEEPEKIPWYKRWFRSRR